MINGLGGSFESALTENKFVGAFGTVGLRKGLFAYLGIVAKEVFTSVAFGGSSFYSSGFLLRSPNKPFPSGFGLNKFCSKRLGVSFGFVSGFFSNIDPKELF